MVLNNFFLNIYKQYLSVKIFLFFIFFIQRSKNKIKEEIKRIIKKKSLKYSNQI